MYMACCVSENNSLSKGSFTLTLSAWNSWNSEKKTAWNFEIYQPRLKYHYPHFVKIRIPPRQFISPSSTPWRILKLTGGKQFRVNSWNKHINQCRIYWATYFNGMPPHLSKSSRLLYNLVGNEGFQFKPNSSYSSAWTKWRGCSSSPVFRLYFQIKQNTNLTI